MAQGDVIDQHDQPDGRRRLVTRGPHRHIADDHRQLAFQIKPQIGIGKRDRITRAEECVGGPLVHQWLGGEILRQRQAASARDEIDVIEIGRSVQPLIGARQGRQGGAFVEPVGRKCADFEIMRQILQPGGDVLPIIQSRLQRVGDGAGGHAAGQITADDDQGSVTRAVPQCG